MTNEATPAVDPFEKSAPVAGLEPLGRAIVDKNGAPSGSPANYEATRGREAYHVPTDEEKGAQAAAIATEFGVAPETPETESE